MKRLLISLFACGVLLLSFMLGSVVQAQPLTAISLPGFSQDPNADQAAYINLEEEIIPQIANALTPKQREQFETAIEKGASLRKAFKSLALSPEQKAKLGTMFGSLPKKDIFATMTSEQKKEIFMKKKDLFIPTPQEISEKITEKMQAAQKKLGEELNVEEIREKIEGKAKMIESQFGN